MTLQQLLEKVENIEKYTSEKTPEEESEWREKLKSEILRYGDEIVEPISKFLESENSFTRDFCLDIISESGNEKFIPKLISVLKKEEEDNFCDEVVDIILSNGWSSKVREALKEEFKNKKYYFWLVEASMDDSDESYDFAENIVEDFINNYEKYEDWFDIEHFMAYLDKSREKFSKLVKEVLKLNLTREEKIEIKTLIESPKDLKKQIELQQVFVLKMGLRGAIDSPAAELVEEGERPVINDSNLKEYIPILHEIERAIVYFYREHPELKDGDVVKGLKNLRDKIWNYDYIGDTEFEEYLMMNLKIALFILFRLNYTKGEVSACISYVLNSVKRHRDFEEGYLEFIKNQFEKEKVSKETLAQQIF